MRRIGLKDNIVSGHFLAVGEKVKIINGTNGAFGADGKTGVVIKDSANFESEDKVRGRHYCSRSTLLIRCNDGELWRVGKSGEFMLLNNKHGIESIDIIYKGKQTKAVIGNKVGVSTCNVDEDVYDSYYGALISIARAMDLGEDKVQGIIDVLFDDVGLEKFSEEELLDEIVNRRAKRQS